MSHDDSRDLRADFLASGWAQGAILPPTLAAKVQMIPGADVAPENGRWFIVVSQDCDLVYGDCVIEPVAEVVLATPIDQISAKCDRLRDPREAHLRLTRANGDPQPVAIRARNRGFISRQLLLTEGPASDLIVGPEVMPSIVAFLGRRYDRVARPESFDQRFKKARKKIIELAERESNALLDVMLNVVPRHELDATERYSVTVYAILQDEFADKPLGDQRARRNVIKQDLRHALNLCRDFGIDVDDIRVTDRYDLSIREYMDLLPMDLSS